MEMGSDEDRRSNEAPFVITDEIDPVVSYATDEGKVFDSRSALKAHYKEHGFEMTGGDHIKTEAQKRAEAAEYKAKRFEDIKKDVQITLNKTKWGMAPITEREKYICQQEERRYQQWKKSR